MTTPVAPLVTQLTPFHPSEYPAIRIRVYLSSSSDAKARQSLPAKLFHIQTILPPDQESRWQTLLMQRRLQSGDWLQQAPFLAPEVASRWSAWAVIEQMATSLGYPARWTVRIGFDNEVQQFTSEEVATATRGSLLGAERTTSENTDYTERYSALELIRQFRGNNSVDLFMVLQGGTRPRLVDDSITREDILAAVPAYFDAAARGVVVVPIPQENPSATQGIQFDNTCFFSGLATSTETAHLFDAGMHIRLIRELARRLQESLQADVADLSKVGTLWRDCWEGCQLLLGAQEDKVQEEEGMNMIAVESTSHKFLDRRLRVAGTEGNCLLVCPSEERLGLVIPSYGPEAYDTAVILREYQEADDTTAIESLAFDVLVRGKELRAMAPMARNLIKRSEAIVPGLVA